MEGEEKKQNKHQNDMDTNWIENRPATATTTA